jgi:frataxin-like iron-binding protein CyaY
MKWISCDGGPHVLMERSCMEQWEAGDIPSNNRVVKASHIYNEATGIVSDYDLACEINDYIGIIELQSGSAIVINDDVPMSAWVTDSNGIGYIIILYTWENKDYSNEIPEIINNLEDSDFMLSGILFKVREDELYLFPASDRPLDPIYEFVKISIEPGNYKVYRLDSLCTKNGELRIFKFQKE